MTDQRHVTVTFGAYIVRGIVHSTSARQNFFPFPSNGSDIRTSNNKRKTTGLGRTPDSRVMHKDQYIICNVVRTVNRIVYSDVQRGAVCLYSPWPISSYNNACKHIIYPRSDDHGQTKAGNYYVLRELSN